MKLSEFIEKSKALYPDSDPEMKVVCERGFSEIKELLSRSAYRDENFFGSKFEKGEFVCIEFL